ncbi:hypothetical protein C8J57DRAFT_1534963 [Mycena rebaudengoi]|nr:hypothetical protein C8J57DRAFT_1534963 [Mycena rebaudengoi]
MYMGICRFGLTILSRLADYTYIILIYMLHACLSTVATIYDIPTELPPVLAGVRPNYIFWVVVPLLASGFWPASAGIRLAREKTPDMSNAFFSLTSRPKFSRLTDQSLHKLATPGLGSMRSFHGLAGRIISQLHNPRHANFQLALHVCDSAT